MDNMDKKIGIAVVVAGVVGLIVGAVIGWMVASSKYRPIDSSVVADQNGARGMATNGVGGDGNPTGESTGTEAHGSALGTSSSISAPSVASISVSNQGAQNAVTVSLVSSDSPAWLAVREYNNGIAGNILGAKRIDLGTTAQVVVPLLRPTEAGKLYYVVLFKDNGDRAFDFRTDPPMTSNGTLISETFLAS